MIDQPEQTGISIHGTDLTAEETAALLTVVNTQLTNTPPQEPAADSATRDRAISSWATFDTWRNLPGH